VRAAKGERKPFFLFDASPLVVVMFKGKLSYDGIGEPHTDTQTMYFTRNSQGHWVWTNSTYVTAVDKIFRQEPLIKAALLPSPFSRLKIQ